jgi:hypothetical protein
MNLLVTFIILNVVNVVIQTVKSIATVKCGKVAAAVINAVAYGLYTVVTVYMMCELSLGLKALIVGLANLVGVYIVKLIEEKSRKDKLWCVQATIPLEVAEKVKHDLKANCLPHNYIDIEKYYLFNVYCENQEQSTVAKVILDYYNAKYFVSESKNL